MDATTSTSTPSIDDTSSASTNTILEDTRQSVSYIRRYYFYRTNHGYTLDENERESVRRWFNAEHRSFIVRPVASLLAAYAVLKFPVIPAQASVSTALMLFGIVEAVRGPLSSYGKATQLVEQPQSSLAQDCRRALRLHFPKNTYTADFDRRYPGLDIPRVATANAPTPNELERESTFFLRDFMHSSLLRQVIGATSTPAALAKPKDEEFCMLPNEFDSSSSASDAVSNPAVAAADTAYRTPTSAAALSMRTINTDSIPRPYAFASSSPSTVPVSTSSSLACPVRRNEYGDEIVEDEAIRMG